MIPDSEVPEGAASTARNQLHPPTGALRSIFQNTSRIQPSVAVLCKNLRTCKLFQIAQFHTKLTFLTEVGEIYWGRKNVSIAVAPNPRSPFTIRSFLVAIYSDQEVWEAKKLAE